MPEEDKGMNRIRGILMLMAAADWDRVLDTNLNGAFRWCKAVSRPMLMARRGVML